MTTRSRFNGFILYNEAEHDEDAALSVTLGIQMLNNAVHAADMAGQVRIAWPVLSGVTLQAQDAVTSATDPDWALVWRFGPWPAVLDEKGNPYSLRVNLAAHSSNGDDVNFRVSYGPRGQSGAYVSDDTLSNVEEFFTASPTNVWLAPDQVATAPVLSFDRDEIDVTEDASEETAANRNTRKVDMELSVWTQDAVGASVVRGRLTGLYAAEYYDAA